MKKFLLSFIAFLLVLGANSQNTFELQKISISKAGSQEIIHKTILPHNLQTKVDDYDSLNMSFTGSWSLGQSFCIAKSPTGDTIFIGVGAGVIIMDVTDPYNPIKLSEIHARALVDDICYDPIEERIYLAAYFSGLEIWDVSDILLPVRNSRIAVNGLPRSGIYEKWNGSELFCILATVADGVQMFNVSEPNNPTFVGSFPVSNLVWSSAFYENTLFLGQSNSGTKILNGFDAIPAISQYGTINTPTTGLYVTESLAYITNSSSGLKIYEWQEQPAVLAGQLPITGYPYNIDGAGDYCYIANSTTNPGGGIDIVNISDTALPVLAGYYNSPQTFITGNDDAIFATGGMGGCVMLDVTDKENPLMASQYNLPGSVNDIAVEGDYAYTGSNGFRVFDVSDKSNPIQVGFNDTEGTLVKIYSNTVVYCPKSMGSNNKVNIMDVSDKENPVKIGYYNAPVMTFDLDLKGYYAFVACWWDGIRVVDYSNPENPVLASHFMGWANGAIPGEEYLYCQALDIEGNYLYAIDYGPFSAEDTKGLYIFDITDPENPGFVTRLTDIDGTIYDIEVSNGYAYLADNMGGFVVVSVVDPLFPSQIAYLPLGDAAWAVDVFDNYAFVANYINEGVQVIDISNPFLPTVAGYYKQTGCFALNVTYNAGHVFVADGPAGMQIYNFDLLTGLKTEVGSVERFDVFPNPAHDKIFITSEIIELGNVKIALIELTGRVVFEKTMNQSNCSLNTDINVNDLPRGVYLLKVSTDKRFLSKKIILK